MLGAMKWYAKGGIDVSCYKLSADRRHWRVLSNSSCSGCSTVRMETPSPLQKSAHVPKTQQFHDHPSQSRKGLKQTLPVCSQAALFSTAQRWEQSNQCMSELKKSL